MLFMCTPLEKSWLRAWLVLQISTKSLPIIYKYCFLQSVYQSTEAMEALW